MTKIHINGRDLEGAVYVTIGGRRIDLDASAVSYEAPECKPVIVELTGLEDAGPITAIQQATRMLWAKSPPIDAELAWCGACGMSMVDCACGVADALAKYEAKQVHEATMKLLPPPPSEGMNRKERRANDARKRRGR